MRRLVPAPILTWLAPPALPSLAFATEPLRRILPGLFARSAESPSPLATGVRRLVVVSHTHWDREWYLPFEEFRSRLVGVVDGILDLLDRDERFRHFMLDGQTIVLDDYLEVRPERRSEVERLVRSGRLQIGPWYVMPDEFLVSGESLVRNLLYGLRAANALGGAMPVGYLPDTFGHIAQLPQVLRGFGIESAVVWRGVDDPSRDAFDWRSPDGSSVFTYYLRQGYSNAEHLPASAASLRERLDQIVSVLAPRHLDGSLLLMNGGDHVAPQPELPDLLDTAARQLGVEVVHGTLPGFLADLRAEVARLGLPIGEVSGELRSARLAPLLAGVLSTRIWLKQRNAAAQYLLERWAEPFAVFAGQSASDRPLLQLAWRQLLRNHPHDSICGCGVDVVHDEMIGRFDRAEQIAGRIVDNALAALAEQVNTSSPSRRSTGHTRGHVVVFNPTADERSDFVTFELSLPDASAEARLVAIDGAGREAPCQVVGRRPGEPFSVTAPRERVEPLLRLAGNGEGWRLAILEKAVAALAGCQLGRLTISGASLRTDPVRRVVEVEVETGGRTDHDHAVVGRIIRGLREAFRRGDARDVRFVIHRGEQLTFGFVARNLPSLGYRAFRVADARRSSASAGSRGASAVAPSEAVESSELGTEISNEHYRITVDSDSGSLTVLDRASGEIYSGLDRLVDSGEAGDEYTYCPPGVDRIVDAPSQPASVEIVERGPARATMLIRRTYALPATLTADRRERSAATVECQAITRVSLSAGVRRIDVETTFENAARDHRLVARFPSGARANVTRALGAFGVDARPVASFGSTVGSTVEWAEQPTSAIPQSGLVHVADERRGLAILAPGLPEVEPRVDADGVTLDLTLLRAVGWLSRDDLSTRRGAAGPSLPTPGAQGTGKQTYRYALVPGALDWSAVLPESAAFAAPPRAVVTGAHTGPRPVECSFLRVEPAILVVSTVKPAESGRGFVVRVFNPTDREVSATLDFATGIESATEVDLAETAIGPLTVDGGRIGFAVRGGGIFSARVEPVSEPASG